MNTLQQTSQSAPQEKPDLYFAELIFISGEYEQRFPLFFKALSMKQAEKMVHKYLMEYYPRADLEDEDMYFYDGGSIAIKFYNIKKLSSVQEEAIQSIVEVFSM